MYLDRQFAKEGYLPFFWLQNKLSTEAFRFVGVKGTLRTVRYWWRKKGELFFRYTGELRGQDADDE
jgi:hypothetical protein